MQQRSHSNASTNIRLRSEIHNSTQPVVALAFQYSVLESTIRKWKSCTLLTDKSAKPSVIHDSISELEMLITVNLRTIGGL